MIIITLRTAVFVQIIHAKPIHMIRFQQPLEGFMSLTCEATTKKKKGMGKVRYLNTSFLLCFLASVPRGKSNVNKQGISPERNPQSEGEELYPWR